MWGIGFENVSNCCLFHYWNLVRPVRPYEWGILFHHRLNRCNIAPRWKTWIRIWTTRCCWFIFRCKHSQLPNAQCHVNMACSQWLETWDVAIIYTGGTRICVIVQWMSVDCMIMSRAKLYIIWTVLSTYVWRLGNPKHRAEVLPLYIQSGSFTSVHPLHYFVAKHTVI